MKDALIVSDITQQVRVICFTELGDIHVRIERTDKGPQKPVAAYFYPANTFYKAGLWDSRPDDLPLEVAVQKMAMTAMHAQQRALLRSLNLSQEVRDQIDTWFFIHLVVACRSLQEY